MQLTGAQLLIALLERQGVELIAGIPGGTVLPIYDALSRSKCIRHVLARHEQGAGFIASGYARATGRAGVCIASSGPGATNLVTAIADAKMDSVPLVCLTGQVSAAMIGTDAFQEVDTFGITLPIVKHSFALRDAAELLDVVPAAFRIALSGRPGPVLIDLPKNVQTQTVSFDTWPQPGEALAPQGADQSALREAARLINAAERPLLYLGGGVIASRAAPLAVVLAEKCAMPTTMTLMALGAMPAGHALSLGMLGMHGARATNLALEECDLLLAIGARFDDRATGKVAAFCPNATIVHIDIDAAELGKIKKPRIAIRSDARTALDALFPLVEAKPRIAWLERIASLKASHGLRTPGIEEPTSHYGLIDSVARSLEALGEEALIATDVGQHQMWVAQSYPLERSRQWLTSGGLGTMGFGLPAAIGAALAHPQRTVVCFTGDGSLKMNIQELATAAEEQANVKIVLMDNGALGLVCQQQELFYGNRQFGSRYRKRTDFVRIAEGFGIPGVDLDGAQDPQAELLHALGAPGPCLIHATIDVDHKVFPMVPPGAANAEMVGG